MTEPNPTPATQLDVLIAVTRLEGKVDGALAQQAQHDSRLTEQRTELTTLRDKVVALETQRKATPSWTASVPALVAVVTLLLILARDWYGGH